MGCSDSYIIVAEKLLTAVKGAVVCQEGSFGSRPLNAGSPRHIGTFQGSLLLDCASRGPLARDGVPGSELSFVLTTQGSQ